MDSPFFVKVTAEEIAFVIINDILDPRILKTKDGKIKVISSMILPPATLRNSNLGNGKRFYYELMKILKPYGYKRFKGSFLIPPKILIWSSKNGHGIKQFFSNQISTQNH